MATQDATGLIERISAEVHNVGEAIMHQIETTETELKNKFENVETKIVATGQNPKVRKWIYIGAGVIILILLAVILFGKRGGGVDQSAIDERIRLRDTIAAMKATQEASKAAAVEQVENEKRELQAENERLTQAFITNQEKHVIINRKNENNNSSVRAIDNEDSLRRAAFGN
jgi:CHASE3 domain sensor protein